jgi:hypothetical protein
LTANIVSVKAPLIHETAAGIGLQPFQRMLYIIYECRVQFISTVLTGFGRAIAEVGAVQMVGGNVQFKTRVMTTAIMMQTNMGHFEFAIALGVVLLVIAFLINSLVSRIQESAGWHDQRAERFGAGRAGASFWISPCSKFEEGKRYGPDWRERQRQDHAPACAGRHAPTQPGRS